MQTDAASKPPKLSWSKKLSYGLGHVFNDLCASMWFTYLLPFFQQVLGFDAMFAGVILLTGQLADGISTLFVGYFSDKGDDLWLCSRYGKRKTWHLIGTICVVLSFPFIFMPCIECADSDQSTQLAYYLVFVVVFQFGWAATQISHLAMIPDLSSCTHERTGLTSVRYAFTVISNVSIYITTWIVLGMKEKEGQLSQDDQDQFRNVMMVAVILGAFSSIIFHLTVKYRRRRKKDRDNNDIEKKALVHMTVLDWMKHVQFHLIAGIYMTTRLFVNLTQSYIPLYLQITLKLEAYSVATVPLVMFLFGFITSMLMKKVNKKIGRKFTYMAGCAIGIAGCVWVLTGSKDSESYTAYQIYAVAAVIGSGASTMLITSLSLTAELIGESTDSGAFVYGFMSLSDKVSNGLVVIAIQHFIPDDVDTSIESQSYYRDVVVYICGGVAFVGALFAVSLLPFEVGVWEPKKAKKTDKGEKKARSTNPFFGKLVGRNKRQFEPSTADTTTVKSSLPPPPVTALKLEKNSEEKFVFGGPNSNKEWLCHV